MPTRPRSAADGQAKRHETDGDAYARQTVAAAEAEAINVRANALSNGDQVLIAADKLFDEPHGRAGLGGQMNDRFQSHGPQRGRRGQLGRGWASRAGTFDVLHLSQVTFGFPTAPVNGSVPIADGDFDQVTDRTSL
jgi:hypothetical protein